METEQNCNIMVIIVFLSCSPMLLSRGPGGSGSLGADFLYRILSPTDWTSCAPSYIIVRRLPFSCGRHKSHSFNPSTVKVVFWYSSTGCTCYLHRCISYFDSPAGSEVNIQYVNRTLSGVATPRRIRPGTDRNEGVLRIPQISSVNGASPSDCLVSYQNTSWWGS